MRYIKETHLFTFDELSNHEKSKIITGALNEVRKNQGDFSGISTYSAERKYDEYLKEQNQPCPDIFNLFLWKDQRVKDQVLEMLKEFYYKPNMERVKIEEHDINARLTFKCPNCEKEEVLIATDRGHLPNKIVCWACNRYMEIKEPRYG